MLKVLLSLLSITFLGCGGASDSSSHHDTLNIKDFNPYQNTYFPRQWHLKIVDDNIARTRNISDDSHIHINGAWKITRGKGVKVAVIDYDFNSEHKDLVNNIVATYDVETHTTKVKKNFDSHGTACASVIAATNNNLGIIGVAPESQLILITADLTNNQQKAEAFRKAKELGADVISCSWSFLEKTDPQVEAAIQEMYDSNIVVVFSSGNNGIDLDSSPKYQSEPELPWVIGVGATTEDNKKAPYSNYGKYIDILAPGGRANGGLYAIVGYNNETYGYFHGTSASAPVVAGVVALMLSANPNLTPDQVRSILLSTADKIDKDVAKYNINGFSHTYAYGKVNASAAVAKALTY